MTEKLKLHTSIEKRKKQHRDAYRKINWGSGVATEAKFTKDMLYPSFWGAWIAIGILYLTVQCLPYKAIKAVGHGVGRLMYKVLKSRRYVVQRNLELAYPQMSEEERKKLEKQIFLDAGMGIFDTGIAWFWSDKRILKHTKVDPATLEKAQKIAADHERIIVFGAHFVALEVSARVYALLIRPGTGIYRSSDHPVWEYIQVKGRLRANLGLVDRKDVRSMIKALMKGLIWYSPDQDFGRQSSVFVPFLGVKEAATVTGLHSLSKIKGVVIQPYWVTHDQDGFQMHILDLLENIPSDDEIADTAYGNKIVEQMIATAPSQYLWMHRRFKTAPEGAPERYPKIG